MHRTDREALGLVELIGFAISSSGGPLALATIYLIQSAKVPAQLLGFVTLGGALLFLAPLSIWLGYSRKIASSGGLYAFVQQAMGARVAFVHGVLWSVSYLLYLPFTVTYIVYYLLPEIVFVSPTSQTVLEVGLPVFLSATVVVGRRASVVLLAGLGVGQLALIGALIVALRNSAVPPSTIRSIPDAPLPIAAGLAGVSLLFVCSSLVLYLGGEARGGAKAMRVTLIASYVIVAVGATLVAFVISPRLSPQVVNSAVPGYALAVQTAGPLMGSVVGFGTLASLAGLIVAEYVALTRLWDAMFHLAFTPAAVAIGVFFILADVVSLVGPFKFYAVTVVPSLAALFLAQLIVFLAFPFFQEKRGRWSVVGGIVVVVASAWALYGLYLALAPTPIY